MADMSNAAKLQALTYSNLAHTPSCTANSIWPTATAMNPPLQNLDLGLGTVTSNDGYQTSNMLDASRLCSYQGLHNGLSGAPMSSSAGHPNQHGYWSMAAQNLGLPPISMLYMGLERPQLGPMHSAGGGGGGCCMHMKRACLESHHHVPMMPVWRPYQQHAQLHVAQPLQYQQVAEPVMNPDPATMTLEQSTLNESDALPAGTFHLLSVDTLNENLNNNNELNLEDDNDNNDLVDAFVNTESHVTAENETQNTIAEVTKIEPGCIPVAWIDEVSAVVTSNIPLEDGVQVTVQPEISVREPEVEEPVTLLQL